MFTLVVSAFDITNSNPTRAKLSDGADSNHQVTVSPPSDSTPPMIIANVSGSVENSNWYVSDVTVSRTVTDNESTVTSRTGCGSTTISADTAGTTLTCSATSAGGTSSQSSTIKRDATAPTIFSSASPAPNAAGWNSTDLTVSFTCGDNLSGIASCGPDQTLSGEGTGQPVTGTAVDNAGNSATETVSGINIDKTAPTLAPTVSPNPVIPGGTAIATANATDSLSGIASESCDVPDTGSVSPKTVSCTATDSAGNAATASALYNVIYNWTGFFRPVDNLPTLNQVKAGSAIPIKFSLSGNQGLGIFAAGYPKSSVIACDSTALVDAVEETVTAGASSLSYDPLADQYVYVWKTDKARTGCRQLVVQLNDGMAYRANFKFTK